MSSSTARAPYGYGLRPKDVRLRSYQARRRESLYRIRIRRKRPGKELSFSRTTGGPVTTGVQGAANESFCQVLRWRFRKQVVQVKGAGIHSEMAIGRAGPLCLGFVPVQFDPVLIRVPQIKGLADSVITCALNWDGFGYEPAQRVRKRCASGVKNGDMVKPGSFNRGR